MTSAVFLSENRHNVLRHYNGQNQSTRLWRCTCRKAENMLGGWSVKLETACRPGSHIRSGREAGGAGASKLRGRFAGAAGLSPAGPPACRSTSPRPDKPKFKSDPRKPLFLSAAIAALVLIVGGDLSGYSCSRRRRRLARRSWTTSANSRSN